MTRNATVKISERRNKNGTSTLILDTYAGSTSYISEGSDKLKYRQERVRKSTGLTITTNPRNKKEKDANKEAYAIAEEMRRQHELELAGVAVIDKSDLQTGVDFYVFYEDYIDTYTKKDKKHVGRAIKYFKEYLGGIRKYRHLTKRLACNDITKTMVEGYASYLLNRFKGEGPHTTFARFKKVVKRAVEEGAMIKNPCDGVTVKCDTGQLKKDTLTQDEILKLIGTHYEGENAEIRRAFIFCLFTGIRGCDVRSITFRNVSFDDRILKFNQRKTEGHSSSSIVQLPLSEALLEIIRKPEFGNKDSRIFNLPTDTTCNIHLKKWVKAAGIDKHITWHCARHSFGTNLCENDENPMTIMALMGHSSLKYTNVYVRVRDKAKRSAMETLSQSLMPSVDNIR